MKAKEINNSNDEITIISTGVNLEGKLNSSGNIRVDGIVKGDIKANGTVTVGENGEVQGEINAAVINIGGAVKGTVKAKDKIVLESKSSLKGDLITKILVIESGAKFDGTSSMTENGSGFKTESNLPPSNK